MLATMIHTAVIVRVPLFGILTLTNVPVKQDHIINLDNARNALITVSHVLLDLIAINARAVPLKQCSLWQMDSLFFYL